MPTNGAIKALTTDMGADSLKPQIRRWIAQERRQYPAIWSQFLNREDTDEFYLEDMEMGGFGTFPKKDEGDYINFAKPDTGHKTRYQPDQFQLAFAITREDKMFNKIRKVNQWLRALERAGRATAEQVAIMPLNLGFSTSFKGNDGQPLFSTSHVAVNGATQANRPATDVDLTTASLEAGLTSFMTMTGNDGIPIMIQPRYLVVHPSNRLNAERIVGSPNYFTGGTPGAAATGVPQAEQIRRLQIIVDPYLTDEDAWFLLAEKGEHEVWVVWNERPNDRMFDDQWTWDSVYSHQFRMTSGFSSYVGVYGSTGA